MLILFLSYKELSKYVIGENRKYDLFLYLIFLAQISFLPSIPSGYHSPNVDGWVGFSISVVFSLLFYPVFYYLFYRKKNISFIREIVILSVVARLHSFIYVACIAVGHIVLWSFLKLPRMQQGSLIYYILYYVVFVLLMLLVKRKCICNK